jgi:hypothetical protein
MKEFKLTKKELVDQYDKALDEHLDICDWVTYIDGKTVCGFVYGILTKNDIDKPLPIEEFHELYLVKYNEKVSTRDGESHLNTQEVLDVVYDLLCELFTA